MPTGLGSRAAGSGALHFLKLPIPPAERDSYYGLVAVADAISAPSRPTARPTTTPRILPDTTRFENGTHFTGLVRNGVYTTAADGFERGRFIGRNLWDRRHAVVDEERGIVLTILRFGLKAGAKSQNVATSNDRVGEFFTVKSGKIQEIQAVLVNRPDAHPTGWPTTDYGPSAGSTEGF